MLKFLEHRIADQRLLSIPTPHAGQAFLKKQGHRLLRCADLR
jgi:hypothetical protein